MLAEISLNDAVKTYLVLCQAEGRSQGNVAWAGSALIGLADFTGEMDVAELKSMHVLLFLSVQKAILNRKRTRRIPVAQFLEIYAPLFRFLRWLQLNQLVQLELPKSMRHWKPSVHLKTAHPKKKQRPPNKGGRCFLNVSMLRYR